MRKTSKVLSVVLLVISTLVSTVFLASCKKADEDKFARIDGRTGYSSIVYEITEMQGYSTTASNPFFSNDTYYFPVEYRAIDNNGSGEDGIISKVFCVNSEGETEREVILPENVYPKGVLNEKLLCVQYPNSICVIGIDSGEIENTIQIDNCSTIYSVSAFEDAFFVMVPEQIIKYDSSYNEIARIEDSAFSFFNESSPIFFNNNSYYAVVDYGNQQLYYQLDFDNSSSRLVATNEDFNVAPHNCHGKYLMTGDGEYSIDFESSTINILAKWNDINIQPERKSIYTPSKYYVFDDEHFAKGYFYSDFSLEYHIFTYDNSIDYSDRTPLTIGGYGAESDLALRWAVYLYNISQEEYRASIIDYSNLFPDEEGVDASVIRARLIQYFNEGNTPDIFYGYEFDYLSWGESGMVQDLLPLFEEYNPEILSGMTDSIRETITADGHCWEVFPSYNFYGSFGLESVFEGNDNPTMYDVINLSTENSIPICGVPSSSDLAYDVIYYSLHELINRSNDHLLTQSQLTDIVNYAVNNGVNDINMMQISSMEDVMREYTLLTECSSMDIYSFAEFETHYNAELAYIGHPSVYGSAHSIRPDGIVAVSSDTDNTEQCIDLISYLYSTDVQKIMLANRSIPVSQSVLDEFFSYVQDPDSIPENEDVILSFIGNNEPVSQEIVEDYVTAINSIDSVIARDHGLWEIVMQEIESYYLAGKTPSDIADSLQSRLDIYVSENY